MNGETTNTEHVRAEEVDVRGEKGEDMGIIGV